MSKRLTPEELAEIDVLAQAEEIEQIKKSFCNMGAAFDATVSELHALVVAILGKDPNVVEEYDLAIVAASELRCKVQAQAAVLREKDAEVDRLKAQQRESDARITHQRSEIKDKESLYANAEHRRSWAVRTWSDMDAQFSEAQRKLGEARGALKECIPAVTLLCMRMEGDGQEGQSALRQLEKRVIGVLAATEEPKGEKG